MSGSYYHQGVFTTQDGADLWYEIRGSGDGTPAVFNDGLGCDGFIWRYLWEPLASRRTVLHWNYRGHGRSGVPRDTTRIGVEYTCDDLDQLMEHVGIPRAVILGHSMGVQVCLEFHRRHRDRVAGLALLCGSFGTPLDTWHDHSLMRVAFPALRRAVEAAPEVARVALHGFVKTEAAVELGIRTELNRELLRRSDFYPYLEHLGRMHPLYFIRTLDSLKDHSAWDHLPWVDVPTLVVGGETDRFTPVWLSQRMAEAIPQCEYLFVPGGSHTAPLERPGLVNAAIERFFRDRARPTGSTPQAAAPPVRSPASPAPDRGAGPTGG